MLRIYFSCLMGDNFHVKQRFVCRIRCHQRSGLKFHFLWVFLVLNVSNTCIQKKATWLPGWLRHIKSTFLSAMCSAVHSGYNLIQVIEVQCKDRIRFDTAGRQSFSSAHDWHPNVICKKITYTYMRTVMNDHFFIIQWDIPTLGATVDVDLNLLGQKIVGQ